MAFRWANSIRAVFFVLLVSLLGACGSWTDGGGSDRPTSVTVRKGDTVGALAKQYGIPLRDLIDLNGLKPPYTLKEGQVLRLPSPSVHTVVRGDTFYGIARRYGVPVRTLAQLNNVAPPYDIKVGQRLRLAEGASVKGGGGGGAAAGGGGSDAPAASSPTSTPPASSPPLTSPAGETPSALRQAFLWPVKGTVIMPYGPIAKGRHNDGINIAVPAGTTVQAADDGTVVYAGNELQGFGNLLLIKHAGGWMTAYAHNDALLVKKGAAVKRGQPIAKSGQSGNVTAPQLHFEVRKGSTPIDPMKYLERSVSAAPSTAKAG